MYLRVITCLLLLGLVAAGRWSSRAGFRMYQHVIGLASVGPNYSSKSPDKLDEGKPSLLITLVKQCDNAINVVIDKYKLKKSQLSKADPRATSAKKADEKQKSDDPRDALDQAITTNLNQLSGKRVKVQCIIVDVVTFDHKAKEPQAPDYVTHLLLGRARLFSGLTPEATKKIADIKSSKTMSEKEKVAQAKRITEEDALNGCIGVYVFGTSELADLKVGNSVTLEGNIRKAGLYYYPDSSSSLEFEVDVLADSNTSTTKPTQVGE